MSQMRSTLRWPSLLVVVVLCGWAAPAAHTQSLHHHHEARKLEREQIEALESDWQKAMISGDTAMMDKLLSDDYLGVTAGGDLVTKSQQLDRMRNRQVTVTRLDSKDVKFKLIGQIAIVTSLAEIEAQADGRPVRGTFRYTRIYQRLPSGTWKITSFEATRVPNGRGENAVGAGEPKPIAPPAGTAPAAKRASND